MRTHNIRTQEEKEAFENVISDFFRLTEHGYTHDTCEEKIAKYQQKSKKASQSAKARWEKDANALQPQSEGNTNQEPLTKNQEPDKPISPSLRSGEGETSGEVTPFDRCPYSKIVDLYHQILPMCPKVAKLNDTRKRHVRARWNDDLKTLDNWRNYLEHVSESPFLTGKIDSRDGRPPFLADFDWLIKSANVLKVAEGKYHRS